MPVVIVESAMADVIDNARSQTGFVDHHGVWLLLLNVMNYALASKIGGFFVEGFEDAEYAPLTQPDHCLILAESCRIHRDNLRQMGLKRILSAPGLLDTRAGDKLRVALDWKFSPDAHPEKIAVYAPFPLPPGNFFFVRSFDGAGVNLLMNPVTRLT